MAATLLDQVLRETDAVSNGLPDRFLQTLAGLFAQAASARVLHSALALGHGPDILRRLPKPLLTQAVAEAATKVEIADSVREDVCRHLPGIARLQPAQDDGFSMGQLVVANVRSPYGEVRRHLVRVDGLVADRQRAVAAAGEEIAYTVRPKASDYNAVSFDAPVIVAKSRLTPAHPDVVTAFTRTGQISAAFLTKSVRRDNQYGRADFQIKDNRLILSYGTVRALMRPTLLQPVARDVVLAGDIVVADGDELGLLATITYDAQENKLTYHFANIENFRKDEGGGAVASLGYARMTPGTAQTRIRLASPVEVTLFLSCLFRFI